MRTSLLTLSILSACNRPDLAVRKAPPNFIVDPTNLGSTDTTPITTPTTDTTSSTTTSSTSTTTTSTPSTTSSTTTTTGEPPDGIDISGWQGNVDWNAVVADGWGFSVCKATEGTYYTSDYFTQQYDGAYDVGMIRGAYHFGIPDDTDGATQADYFVDHGGGWSADGQTLPGVLDIEWNPYGSACYGLSKSEMADWIMEFNDQYYVRTGRDAMIYTAASWWNDCVDSTDFGFIPLWIANWGVTSPTLPATWSEYVFWQTADDGSVDGVDGLVDIDVYNGSPDQMYHFALND